MRVDLPRASDRRLMTIEYAHIPIDEMVVSTGMGVRERQGSHGEAVQGIPGR